MHIQKMFMPPSKEGNHQGRSGGPRRVPWIWLLPCLGTVLWRHPQNISKFLSGMEKPGHATKSLRRSFDESWNWELHPKSF